MSTPTLSGLRFNISTDPGSEFEPVVQALADGTFIAVWVESSATLIGPDTSGSAIRAGFFNAAGEPIGSTFQVNNLFDGNQVDPDITVLADGRFLVTWSAAGAISGDGNGTAVKARIFAADGTPEGEEFQVNTYETNLQNNPSVTALDDGGFVVVYDSPLILGVAGFNVGAQFYNDDGSPRGDEIKINATNNGTRNVDVEQLSNGNVVFVWDVFTDGSSGQTDTSGRAVFARVMTASGGPVGGDILVNTTTDDVQQTPQVAALTGGGFVVIWSDNSQTGLDTSSFAIRAQVFTNAGVPVGGEFLVNTTTANGQITPVTLGLSDGRFIIAWTDQSNGTGLDIRARLYNADGTPSGGEVLVTGDINGNQVEPAITELSDGRVLIGWRNINDLAGRVIDPRETSIFVAGDALDDIIFGTRFGDSISGLGGSDRLIGEAGNDDLSGSTGNDTIEGGTGNDRMDGGAGNDTLNGGAGNDLMVGGLNDDRYIISSTADVIIEGVGDGAADLLATSVSFVLDAGVYIEQMQTTSSGGTTAINLTGNALAQRIIGNAGANVLGDGGGAADTMTGLAGNDTYIIRNTGAVIVEETGQGTADRVAAGVSFTLAADDNIEIMTTTSSSGTTAVNLTGNALGQTITGNAGANVLDGQGGTDTLNGLAGSDTLTGGAGADRFVFSTATGAANIDSITDYNVAADTIALENTVFTGLVTGVLTAAAFRLNATGLAEDGSDRITYNSSNGFLYFDADGNGAGGRVRFADLDIGLALTNADFAVV